MSSSPPQFLAIRPRAASSEGREVSDQDAKEEYLHDAAVAAITSLFAYVSELYGEGYELSYPPPGGWEGFNRDNLRVLQDHGQFKNGLTDRALDLMRW